MKHVAKNLDPGLICQLGDLEALCDRIRQAGSFAFDTEFIMEDGYDTTVCLIQVATENEVALIDPLADLDTRLVWDLVADPSVEAVVHAGMEDLALCHQLTGQVPANVFDVQIANGLVSCDYPLNLGRLVRSLVHVRLHKSQTLTNWRQRPLTDAQLAYAVEDVAYLPAIRHLLGRSLENTDRVDWARQEFARFEWVETYKPPEQSRLFRLKGVGGLDPQRLAVALELLHAREGLARKYNRPPRAMVRDHLLVEIARHRWTRVEQLRSLRGLQLRPAALQQLVEAVKKGLARPPEECPVAPPVVEETPEEVTLTSLLTAVLRGFCQTSEIAFSLLTTKQGIRALLQSHTRGMPPDSPLLKGWRAEATKDMIQDILEGRTLVGVTGTHGNTRLTLARSPDAQERLASD